MRTLTNHVFYLLLAAKLVGVAQGGPAFPVKFSANGRYLVDQNETPFPIMGRTAWFVLSLSDPDYRAFIDDTVSRGFNAIELHVLNHDPRGNNRPFAGNGSLPFVNRLDGTSWNGVLSGNAPDFTTPNETYWSFVEGFLSYCESRGVLVFLFPAYVGYAGGEQGWMMEMVANGPAKMQSYGQWIATRYKDQKNIVWMMGGDMGTGPFPFNPAQTAVESNLLAGLASVTGQQSTLFSAEWDQDSIATDQVDFGTAMTLNGAYSHRGYVNNEGRRAYAYSPVEPAFLLEEPYDEEGADGNGDNLGATQPVRRFQWWGWLSTIGGYISGNGYIIWFRTNSATVDWRNHLDTQGARDMGRLNAFLGSIAWYKLVPSGLGGMRNLITTGGSSVFMDDYVTAAAAPDGTLMVAYVPPAHNGPITVDMGAMSGLTRARWFDPTSGTYVGIAIGLTNSGSRSFTTPGNNSAGAKDWVLVMDSSNGITISDILNQSTLANTATAAIPFTIGDPDTAATSLTLSNASSNPALAPTNNIVFGGSGSNRTVTITPAPGQTGTSIITVSVSDGTNSASDSFVLTVNAVNTAPTITGVPDQLIDEDTTTGPLSFSIGDGETPAASLTLGKASSNLGLVPINNIVFGGSGGSRTVTVTPAANQSGAAIVTISVSDGTNSVSTNFLVTVNAVNDPPTISDIPNQSTPANTPTTAIPFTVNDVDTALASLALSSDSSDPALVPTSNIVFGGSGGSRTVTVTPVTGQTGTVTIVVSVSDGDSSATDTFVLTVNPPNAPPVISGPADQIIDEDAATAALSFSIGDGETPAASLTLGRASSNPGLISTNNIVFGGSGASRTVTLAPVANASGVATITLSVSDGSSATSTSFLLTVNPVNDAPTITGVANQNIAQGASTGPLGFLVGDVETPATSLALSADSSNPALVPAGNIVFGGSGSNRTVTVTGAAGQSGSALITLTVGDGTNSTSTSFTVTVSALTAGTKSYTNATAIVIPSQGAATPYASVINVPNLGGTVSNVTVTLRSLSHTWGNDIDVLLVGPGGQKVTLMSDAGTGSTANNANLTFSNGAAGLLPQSGPLASGTYRPTDHAPADTYPAPAPAGPYGTNLAVFSGTVPAGAWSLYVFDDGPGDQGSFAGGWSLTLTVVGASGPVPQPPTISDILNQSTLANTATAAIPFTIGDPDTAVTSLSLSASSSNPALAPTNNIVFGGSGSNRTVTLTPAPGQTGTSSITIIVSDGTNSASDSFVLTVNAVNTPPTITGVPDQLIDEDTTTGPLSFSIGDGETPAASLTLGKASSNLGLVPTNNIVFGGSGGSRTVTVTPAANQSGAALVTISVSDGTNSVSTNFLVTVNAVNDPPTISDIPNQSTPANTPTTAIPFTVNDVDTPLASLTLSADSSNPTLLPTNNIVFGGSGSSRTVTLTPVTGQTGTVTIAVSVSDGAAPATDTFVLTVNPPNAPPVISGPADQIIDEDTATAALSFTIGDAETGAASLTLDKASSNAALIPTNNIVFGGSGSNRTVTLAPVANASGVATITLSVSDGSSATSTSFLLTVNAVNDAPTITGVASQTIAQGASTGPLGFLVGDVETPATSLALSADSSNPGLVPTNNVVFGGSGANRTVTVTGAAGQSGSALITLNVTDGTNSTPTSFTVTASASLLVTNTFVSTPAIRIPSSGAATPYPSTINVSGTGGVVSNVTVTLSSISHQRMRDIDVLLVGPDGQNLVLISDVGPNGAVNNLTLTLSDAAVAGLGTGALISGTYRPTNITGGDTFAAPAPAAPYGNRLSVFNGQAANGAWSLYVVDDSSGSTGSMAGGWSLTLTTAGGAPATLPPAISDIPNQSTTTAVPTPALAFTVGDPDTAATSLTLTAGSSNPALAPTNNIVFGGSDSNRTVTITPAAGQTGTSIITVTVSDGVNSASDTFVLAVSAVNTPPTITGVPDQIIDEDTVAGPLSFTIGDGETPASSLTLGRSSSNPALVPTNNMIFGGSGSNRTVTVTPSANQSGAATVTISVSDGQASAGTSFLVTVDAVNDAPTISGVANQNIAVGGTAGPLGFVVGDVETPAASLTLDAGSSNPVLVPTNNIIFGGSGSNRTVTVTGAAGQSGSALITVNVTDGTNSTPTSFTVTASALTAGTKSFTNTAAIVIPDSGPAAPYPSVINVTNLGGVVSNVTLTLRNLSHTWTRDIDILLVGPGGQKALVCSDVGNGGANDVTYTLSDAAASALPLSPLVAGTYRPGDYETGDVLAAPAPAGPYTAPLSAFNGLPADGAWSLYVFDDGPGDLGSFAGGWSLTVTTVSGAGDVANSSTPARLSIVLRADKGLVVLHLDDPASSSYVIEASEDLNSWTTLGVVQLVNGSGSFTDDDANLSARRFYRVRVAP